VQRTRAFLPPVWLPVSFSRFTDGISRRQFDNPTKPANRKRDYYLALGRLFRKPNPSRSVRVEDASRDKRPFVSRFLRRAPRTGPRNIPPGFGFPTGHSRRVSFVVRNPVTTAVSIRSNPRITGTVRENSVLPETSPSALRRLA